MQNERKERKTKEKGDGDPQIDLIDPRDEISRFVFPKTSPDFIFFCWLFVFPFMFSPSFLLVGHFLFFFLLQLKEEGGDKVKGDGGPSIS